MEKESLTAYFDRDAPMRLDLFLREYLGASRNQVARLIKSGHVSIDGKPVTKAGFLLQKGARIAWEIPEVSDTAPKTVDFDVPVIYEDDDLLVVNKPSGVVVHPAPSVKEATLVDWLKSRGVRLSTLSGEERHGIVHRLDKETSGALVVAKNNRSHEALASQLRDRTMGRYYLALIDLPLKEDRLVEAPVGRNPANRLKMGVVSGGRPAQTRFVKLLENPRLRLELIAAKLYTGRTHQIRVHLAYLQRHILGDHLYGFKSKRDRIERILLHAYVLYLQHPVTGETMVFRADVPDDMTVWLTRTFEKERLHEVLDPSGLLRRFGDDRHRLFDEKPDAIGPQTDG